MSIEFYNFKEIKNNYLQFKEKSKLLKSKYNFNINKFK